MITITSKATVRLSAKLRREMEAVRDDIRAQLTHAQAQLAYAYATLEQLGYSPCITCGAFHRTGEMLFVGHSDNGTDYTCTHCTPLIDPAVLPIVREALIDIALDLRLLGIPREAWVSVEIDAEGAIHYLAV